MLLSTFIYGKAKAARRKAKDPMPQVTNDPPAIRHIIQTPPSPASFASPEIFDVNGPVRGESFDYPQGSLDYPQGSFDYPPPEEGEGEDEDLYDAQYIADTRKNDDTKAASPRVQLEFHPEPLSDWFPESMLKSDDLTFADALESARSGTESVSASGSGSGMLSTSSRGFGLSSEEDEAIIEPEIRLETSSFVNFGDDSVTEKGSSTNYRKPAPAPIKIPNLAVHGTKVQAHQRTASGPPTTTGRLSSRPDSPVSGEDLSAVSGTTLARALIANSFILSHDAHPNRSSSTSTTARRSGMTRQDSATLPRGENPLMNSPYWRDRRLSEAGDVILTPSAGETIPPVPPVPSTAGLLFMGQKSHGNRHSIAMLIEPSEKYQSSSAEAANRPDDGDALSSSINSKLAVNDRQASRRISRISEAPSPVPSAPGTPQKPPNSARSEPDVDQSSSPAGRLFDEEMRPDGEEDKASSKLAPEVNTESSAPSPLQTPQSVPPSEPPLSAESGQDISQLLNRNYEPISPLPTLPSPRPVESALTPSPTSSPAPSVGRNSNGSRESKKTRSGKIVLGTTSSAVSPRGSRVDWTLPRTRSDPRVMTLASRDGPSQTRSITLLPIGERPHSVHVPHSPLTAGISPAEPKITSSTIRLSTISQLASPPPTAPMRSAAPMMPTNSPADGSPTSPDILDSMLPPPTRGIFARQRSGSTPNPINVVRDSRDPPAYNITVDADHGLASAGRQQTFPETPQAFSPLWSSGLGSPGMPPRSTESTAFNVPQSASGVPSSGHGSLTLAQQIMLSRATMVAMSTGSRPRPIPHPPARPASATAAQSTEDKTLSPVAEDVGSEATSPPLQLQETIEAPSVSTKRTTKELPQIPPPTPPQPMSSAQPGSLLAPAPVSPVPAPTSPSPELASSSPAPASPTPTLLAEVEPTTKTITPPPTNPPPNTVSPPPRRFVPPRPPPPLPLSYPHSRNTPSPPPPHSPPHSPPSSPIEERLSTSFTPSFVPPPPYQATASTPPPLSSSQTETSSSSGHGATFVPRTAGGQVSKNTPTPSPPIKTTSPTPSATINVNGRRTRIRPPLPIGPRKLSGGSVIAGARPRNGSVSSVASVVPNSSSDNLPRSLHRFTSVVGSSSPKFPTTPLKWKGYTMDAAKWTFTSNQLQSIVSRAIKQSAEASSIRLLQLETLDNDIPEEMSRLEAQRVDIKTRYKLLTRKRWTLLGSLSTHVDGEQQSDSAAALRLMEKLAETSASLDQLAEELHNVTDQIGQLKSLRDVHSASALAMALRKLNSSFLNKAAENEILRQRIEALEGERDEAWKQAEEVAQDFDVLNERITDSPGASCSQNKPGSTRSSSSLRASRIMAVRKSSVRASKAGLRPSSNRRSQRSSVASGRRGSSVPSSAALMSAFGEDIPPVPAVPRPQVVTADLPTRSSAFVSSTSPTSATQAMMRAQEELYDMLGIPRAEIKERRPRPRSISGPLSTTFPNPPTSFASPVARPLSDVTSPGYRSSSFPLRPRSNVYPRAMTDDIALTSLHPDRFHI